MGLEFSDFNASADPRQWDAATLKALLEEYVDYHNLVAAEYQAADNATAGNATAGNATAGMNSTDISTELVFEEIWRPEFDAANLTFILEEMAPKQLSYEVFAFYKLFFGQNETEAVSANATDAAAGNATAEAAPAEAGFL